MSTNGTVLSASFGSVDLIARIRPSIGLALGWVAYGLFYTTVAGCLIGPVLLALHIMGVPLG